MSETRARKPKPYELMFTQMVCDQRIDAAVVQLGDDPTEVLDARGARRLAAWLLRAAEWIENKEGER